MTQEEKQQLLAELRRGEEALSEAVRSFTETDAMVRPAFDRWSALECVEHVVSAEEYLFSRILAGEPNGSTKIGREREHLILVVGRDRARRVSAPEIAQPRGRFQTLAHAMDAFRETRTTTLGFVRGCEEDLRSKFTSHPLVGSVNCWEMLLMIAVHPSRHAEQISEIAGSLPGRKAMADKSCS